MNKYYIYAHKRISDNQVFYIGKGCGNRAYSKCRSQFWHNYVKKHNYYVEIIYSNLQETEAFHIERKLISEYGRINKKTGCLVNLTDGGEGLSNYNITNETKQKISKSKGEKVYAYYYGIIVGEFHSAKEAERQTGISASLILQSCNKNTFAGYYDTKNNKFSKQPSNRRLKWTKNISNIQVEYSEVVIPKPRKDGIAIYLVVNNQIINKFPSILAASKESGIDQKTITLCCDGQYNYAGYYNLETKTFNKCDTRASWRYVNEDLYNKAEIIRNRPKYQHNMNTPDIITKRSKSCQKSVVAYCIIEGKEYIIQEFISQKIAYDLTKVNCISKCCKGKVNYAGVYDLSENKFVSVNPRLRQLNRLPPNCIKVKWKYCNPK